MRRKRPPNRCSHRTDEGQAPGDIRAIFRELLSRLESIELTGPAEQTASVLVSGPKRMPVTYSFKG